MHVAKIRYSEPPSAGSLASRGLQPPPHITARSVVQSSFWERSRPLRQDPGHQFETQIPEPLPGRRHLLRGGGGGWDSAPSTSSPGGFCKDPGCRSGRPTAGVGGCGRPDDPDPLASSLGPPPPHCHPPHPHPHPGQRPCGGGWRTPARSHAAAKASGRGPRGCPAGAGRDGAGSRLLPRRGGGAAARDRPEGLRARRWDSLERPAAAGRGPRTPSQAEVKARAARRQLRQVGAEFAPRLRGGGGSCGQARRGGGGGAPPRLPGVRVLPTGAQRVG